MKSFLGATTALVGTVCLSAMVLAQTQVPSNLPSVNPPGCSASAPQNCTTWTPQQWQEFMNFVGTKTDSVGGSLSNGSVSNSTITNPTISGGSWSGGTLSTPTITGGTVSGATITGGSNTATAIAANTPLSAGLVTTPQGSSAATIAGRFGHVINAVDDFGVNNSASDNATALQAAINAAVAAGLPLVIPAPASGGCYKYTAPLTISGNLSIVGTYAAENWNGGINVPLGSPTIVGSVICPTSNGSDAIDISGTSTRVNISNLGIIFQTTLSGTGDGIHYVPAQNVQGLSGSNWNNVIVYGHDGNHYAYNLTNLIYNTISYAHSYGGGGFNLTGNSTSGNYGNSVFVHPLTQVVVGGTAGGFNITANASSRLNLLTFIRPQAVINNVSGVSPGGNLPTGAQPIWFTDGNVTSIRATAPDWEQNVSGTSVSIPLAGAHSDMDWSGLFTDAATINAPAWGTNGVMFGPLTQTFNDTTSSGATGVTAMAAFPGTHVTANSAATYSVLTTLYLAPPIIGTNVSATRTDSLYATGEIFTTSDFGASGGAFITGTVNLNKSNNAVTEIGDGNTTSQVTIGGGSNKVAIGSALTVGSTTALTTSTGEVGLAKIAASGVAPGAAGLKFEGVCGTNAGSMKIIAYAGTSTTPVTIIDNVGSGVTGC